jgi:hypothetical protein
VRATCRSGEEKDTHLGIRVLADIWMVPHRKPLERPLDLLRVCLFPHPENLRFLGRGQVFGTIQAAGLGGAAARVFDLDSQEPWGKRMAPTA